MTCKIVYVPFSRMHAAEAAAALPFPRLVAGCVANKYSNRLITISLVLTQLIRSEGGASTSFAPGTLETFSRSTHCPSNRERRGPPSSSCCPRAVTKGVIYIHVQGFFYPPILSLSLNGVVNDLLFYGPQALLSIHTCLVTRENRLCLGYSFGNCNS